MSGGSIPAGLSLAQAGKDYILSGTPTTAGQYGFSLTLTNSAESITYFYKMRIVDDPSPWAIKANDPALFPYQYTVGDPSGVTFYLDESLTQPLRKPINFSAQIFAFGSGASNGKLYSVIGERYPTMLQSSPGTNKRWYFDNRYAGLNIYNPASDVWASAYWRDLSPVQFLPEGYPVNGMPTGFNNGAGTTRPSAGTATDGGHAIGVSWAAGQAFFADINGDGSSELHFLGGYPNWGGRLGIYDTVANSWSMSATGWRDGSGNATLMFHEPSGKAYLLNGSNLASYDVATQVWTIINDDREGYTPLSFNIGSGHRGAIVGDKMYVAKRNFNSNKVAVYDILTDTWDLTTGTAMPTPVNNGTTVTYNGKIFFIGGDSGTVQNLIQKYDPATNEWTALDVTLPEASYFNGAGIIDNDLYVESGMLSSRQYTDITNTTWAISMVDLEGAAPPAKPVITDVARTASLTITWNSEAGATYRVESSTSPYDYVESNMIWVNEVTGLASGGASTSWTDYAVAGEKYYRVYAEYVGGDIMADDTVGQMTLTINVGRNMVSSPFEPYPDPNNSLVSVPLSGQINVGRETAQSPTGDAINWPIAGNIGSFPGDEAEGYARTLWNPGGTWQYGPYIDFYLAGATDDWVDLSAGGTIEFDCRVYNDPVTNTNPYGDANLFVRMYTYGEGADPGSFDQVMGWIDYGIVYGPTGEDYYPTWTHVTVDVNAGAITHFNFDAGQLFDITKISRMRFYSTNWAGGGDDFVDVKNFKITQSIMGYSTLNKIVGNQLTGHSLNKALSDNIELWDNALGAYKRAWYRTGAVNSWLDWDTSGTPAFGMDADKGYWFNIVSGHPAKNVMFCGRVSKTDRSVPIAVGRNLVGSCFPVGCTLAKSGLVASGFTGHLFNPSASDNVEFWNNTTGAYQRFWYRTGTVNAWQPWNTGEPMRDIVAGDAIWVNVVSGHSAFTWTYPVPPRP